MFDNPSDKKYLIPLAVLKPLAKGPWKYDDYALTQFATVLESHHKNDMRDGGTCTYVLGAMGGGFNDDMMTLGELKAIVKAGAIDQTFHTEHGVNQHWLHSMCQFYAECTKAWIEHEKRTQAILGTPAGRIWRA